MSEEVDQVAIREMYQRLIAARDKPIDADDTIKNDIEASRKFQDALCCVNPFYREQTAIVKASMPDNITSGTVGAYLYGCFLPELAVEIGCTPDCANGLKNPDLDACDIASYEKKQGALRKLNDVNTEEADVFLAIDEQVTSADHQQLKQDGIKVITIFNQDGNNINYILGESINLDQPENSQPAPPGETTTTTGGWGWIWFILVIIIIIALAIAFLR